MVQVFACRKKIEILTLKPMCMRRFVNDTISEKNSDLEVDKIHKIVQTQLTLNADEFKSSFIPFFSDCPFKEPVELIA